MAMVHSFFLIGLGFLLTLKPEAVEQQELAFISLKAEVLPMLAYYVTTGVNLLLYATFVYGIVIYWWAFKRKAPLR